MAQGAPLETHVDDLVAVLDDVGAKDVCLVSGDSARALVGAPVRGGAR